MFTFRRFCAIILLMIKAERSAETATTNTDRIATIAEGALAYVTLNWAERDIRTYLAASRLSEFAFSELGVTDPDELTLSEFRERFVDATKDQCAYLATITGLFLRSAYPDTFRHMMLVMSIAPKDTPEGREEAKNWKYDTWLLLEDAEGTVHTLSPAQHEASKGNPMVQVHSSESVEGALAFIQSQRENWDWPNAQQVRARQEATPTDPNHFCVYSSATQQYEITTVALAKDANGAHIMHAPYRLDTLDLYAD